VVTRKLRGVVVAVALALAALSGVPAATAQPTATHLPPGGGSYPELPLGPRGLPQTSVTQQVAPGVNLTTITRGDLAPSDHYTVNTSSEGVVGSSTMELNGQMINSPTDPPSATEPDGQRQVGDAIVVIPDPGDS